MGKALWTGSLWILGLLGVIAVLSSSARANTIMTYSNQATWGAAVSGVQTIDFGTQNPPSGGLINIAPPGLTLGGVTFSSGTSNDIQIVNQNFCCATYARGFDTLNTGPGGSIVVTLPTGVTAVGFQLYDVEIGDVAGTYIGTADITVGGNTYAVTTPQAPGSAFFGFVASNPVSSFTIAPVGNSIGVSTDIMNFSFGGTPTTPTPEPSSLLTLGSGLIALGGLLKFKGKRLAA